MRPDPAYKVVQLRNGVRSIHSVIHGETMHPGLGPGAEAEALYVRQLDLVDRVNGCAEKEFVIWDVGLGAGANAVTVLRALRGANRAVRVVSFDHTLEPLRFAYVHREQLGYLAGFERVIESLLGGRNAEWAEGMSRVIWEVHLADFPALLKSEAIRGVPRPEVILFDPWSPSRNPAMWTAPLFSDLRQQVDGGRCCVLATYSRSTLLRVSLLLAGFFVGAGRATGMKDETTIAATDRGLIENPLDSRWLERACRSQSAEPLCEPVYRQAPLTEETRVKLCRHLQFAGKEPGGR